MLGIIWIENVVHFPQFLSTNIVLLAGSDLKIRHIALLSSDRLELHNAVNVGEIVASREPVREALIISPFLQMPLIIA